MTDQTTTTPTKTDTKFLHLHSLYDGSPVLINPAFIICLSSTEAYRGPDKVIGTSITDIGGHQLWVEEKLEQVMEMVGV